MVLELRNTICVIVGCATMERLKEQAWHRATQKLRQPLDVTEIYGHLCSRSYLTEPQKKNYVDG